ncbi:3'-5' exonuclease [Sphaerisporangium sp. NPDC051017]|uniref:3'-5' exonuclease n=1 Tax=Sphaerisporangium sp. NPDC051017 TaxID=3154636 RepID=UPI00341E999E
MLSNGELERRYLNVVDVEATCWKGKPPRGQVSEIIEIGLCVVDLTLRRQVTKHNVIVRPARSKVSRFCTELTGHTQETVDAGIPFADACHALMDVHDSQTRPWASWGDYDRRQFERQCAAEGTPYPFHPDHTNAKKVFAEANGLPRGVGMTRALTMSDLPWTAATIQAPTTPGTSRP